MFGSGARLREAEFSRLVLCFFFREHKDRSICSNKYSHYIADGSILQNREDRAPQFDGVLSRDEHAPQTRAGSVDTVGFGTSSGGGVDKSSRGSVASRAGEGWYSGMGSARGRLAAAEAAQEGPAARATPSSLEHASAARRGSRAPGRPARVRQTSGRGNRGRPYRW